MPESSPEHAIFAAADPDLNDDIARLFGPEGKLAQRLPGYRVRASQLEMAHAVSRTLTERGTLVAEAGTGTGKTYAYLAPALLQGGKVLVSTGTKTLQDQLFARDLPQLVAAMEIPANIALLKGRGNYLCHLHLERTEQDDRALGSRQEVAQLGKIRQFARRTRTGDIAELSAVPDNAPIWHKVTSTRDNCLGSECEYYRDCFVVKARKAAQEAEVVVVNHALFLADLALKDEGISELLPAADCVIFDEAHQLPDVATRFLGESVSTHQLLDFARDSLAGGLRYSPEGTDWSGRARELENAVRELRLSCVAVDRMAGQKSAFDALPEPTAFGDAVALVMTALNELGKIIIAVRERHPDLELLARRVPELRSRLKRWLADDQQALMPEEPAQAADSAASPTDDQAAPADINNADAWVRWVETSGNHVRLHAAPLSVAHAFSRYRPEGQAWILTSATLAVRTDFSHFTRQLGLQDAQTGQWESPFDYATNARLFVPHGVPEPNQPGYTDAFVTALAPLIAANRGSALVLCTTLRAVDQVHRQLAEIFQERNWDWPLLRQGERGRRELLQLLRTQRNAVLVGSASFWEGIDVPGDALTLVAIDKLPFAPPDDPVIEARIKASRKRGGNPFFEFQLPQAAIALKQGAGRLIRAEDDWGVLMVADRRLVEKPYGKLLWRGLPPFGRTRSAQEVEAFLHARRGEPTTS